MSNRDQAPSAPSCRTCGIQRTCLIRHQGTSIAARLGFPGRVEPPMPCGGDAWQPLRLRVKQRPPDGEAGLDELQLP